MVSDPSPPTTPPSTSVRAFLIADVRGYTSFTDEHGDEAAARLADRFAVIAREVIANGGGSLLGLRGDEAIAAFDSPRGALRTALTLQSRFHAEVEANPSLPLLVGIGIDAGEAIPVQGDYRGGALNLAARLCSLAGPGEVFVSEGLVHLTQKSEGFSYVNRGEATLKGLPAPIRIIQVIPEGEPQPAVKPFVVYATPPSNLPAEPTPFIGREREIQDIGDILRSGVRLLTLTGPGGAGKTRLALQVAREVMESFRQGVYFVSLAVLTDPALVLDTIAATLEVQDGGAGSIFAALVARLRDQRLLLVLDNVEHLLAAAPDIARLLAACPDLAVLVTSRAVLHLVAEHEYPVPPLGIPNPAQLPDAATLSQFDAVKLFIQRAAAIKPCFAVNNENAPAIAEICSRLDGLPLAIELAAARIRLFPPQALLSRLEHRLQVLTGGARDLPERQQTLRGAIDWSYRLLDEASRRLFARLAVFAGGCTIEAAAAVCDSAGDLGIDILDGIATLVESSLLAQHDGGDGEPRFVMLETIREYAAEQLTTADAAERIRAAHAEYYRDLAREGMPALTGAEQSIWLRRLEAEMGNFRAALRWSLDTGEVKRALQLCVALWRFWDMHGYLEEGQRWLAEALDRTGERKEMIHAQALYAQAMLLRRLGDLAGADRALEEGLVLCQLLGNEQGIHNFLSGLAAGAQLAGDWDRARSIQEDLLARYRGAGDRWNTATVLMDMGIAAYWQGEHDRASELLEESLTIYREMNDRRSVAMALCNLGGVAREQGNPTRARSLFEECLAACVELDDEMVAAECVEGLAQASVAEDRVEVAARLFGAADSLRGKIGWALQPADLRFHQRYLARAQEQLDVAAWYLAWREGQEMTLADLGHGVLEDRQPI